MSKVLPALTPELEAFIAEQAVFFVATGPLAAEGHLNLSPKGQDSLRVLAPDLVGYLDLTGSSNETAAHLLENGRITLMLCAFHGQPRILRLHGHGRVVLPTAPNWPDLIRRFPPLPGARQIILVQVTRVSVSCGMAVPKMQLDEPRMELLAWAERKGPEGLREYQARHNRRSLDNLPTPFAPAAE